MPWLDAAWHPAAPVDGPIPLDPTDRGLLLGDGVFDTSLVLGGRMVWRAAHLRRLRAHARSLGFVVEAARLERAVDGVLGTSAGGHGALRLTVTRGAGPRGVAPPREPLPTVLASLAPLSASALFAPVALLPTAIRRNETSPLARVKSLNYGDAVLAAAEARDAGCDDALFLNTLGRVVCAGTGNLFAVFGDALVTPPLEDGVLDGVTRALLLAGAARIGLAPVERALSLVDLATADVLLATSSLRLVAPVVRIAERRHALHPCADAISALAAEAVIADVGIDPRLLDEAVGH